MEKVTLFENLLNATARHATVTNFAALMGVDDQTVFDLLTLYRSARRNGANEMIMDVFLDCNAADAARILDAAGIRSILVCGHNVGITAEVKITCAFMHEGWQACPTVINCADGDRPAQRLTRA